MTKPAGCSEDEPLRNRQHAEKVPVAALRVDDVVERQRIADHQHRRQREPVRELVADHLRRGAQPAEQRILAVRAPAGEDDAVDAHRGDGEEHEDADVDVGRLQLDLLRQQPEEVGGSPPRHDNEGGEARRHRQDRRQREEHGIGGARLQLLLEEQLDDVGHRLQHAPGTDAVGAEPLLHEGGHLALHEHQHRRRVEQHEEREAQDDEVADEDGIQWRQVDDRGWMTGDRLSGRVPSLLRRRATAPAAPGSDPRECSARIPRGSAGWCSRPARPRRRRTGTASCR